jgi:DNA invertase Pin-like site-specific DNA recombinase/DNA-binding transcriptional regulator YiaG
MEHAAKEKVTREHLSRKAYLYIRQSTLRQVADNQESTRRQYGLRQRATALGWPAEQIEVIDCDLGLSGASASDRQGFQKLVAEVGMGQVGIVLGLEVSRLARNCADWHRLLEICALSGTLILDEDGIYDPTQYNDRLLLGLKGTLSEAELHMLRARMRGGLLAKARRGELRIGLPVGFVYDDQDRVVLHPDVQVRRTLELFFHTFRRTGTAGSTVKRFTVQNIPFPRPAKTGARTAEVVWGRLSIRRAVSILHNPRYAGAFAYGRNRIRKQPDGRYQKRRLPQDQWLCLLLDNHPGYISWKQYERNEHRLEQTAKAFGLDGSQGPPREGPALLQGLVVCGRCGARMSVHYHRRREQRVPDYHCLVQCSQHRLPPCQSVPGSVVDETVGQLLIETMSPMALEISLAVQAELEARLAETDQLRQQQIERAEQETGQARYRYMQVDPGNRLVAVSLEADWNEKLRALEQVRDRVESQRSADRATFDEKTKQRIRALATDFPALWKDPATPNRERKRMVALLLEDVTLHKQDGQISIGIRFRGGATKEMSVPVPLNAWRRRQTHPKALARAAELVAEHTSSEVATRLNEEGFTTGAGARFSATAVRWLRTRWKLKNRQDYLRDAGKLTSAEMAARLGISERVLRDWRQAGCLRATRCNDRGDWMYEPVEQQSDWIQQQAVCKDICENSPEKHHSATTVA